MRRREIYLDVETQRCSEEVVGGWNNIPGFGLAVAITWDEERKFQSWGEEQAGDLLQDLGKCSRIITFNGENFDFRVLSAYGKVDRLYLNSWDLLTEITQVLGHRVKLDQLAEGTLGRRKTADGKQAVLWWRSGDLDLRQKVIDYCKEDVAILMDLVGRLRQFGFLQFVDFRGRVKVVRIPPDPFLLF